MKLHSLGNRKKRGYTTWGCMWKQGSCSRNSHFALSGSENQSIPMQTRITAVWPDGSVKWTAHTANSACLGDEIEVRIGEEDNGKVAGGIRIIRKEGKLNIEAGKVFAVIGSGEQGILERFSFEGKERIIGAWPVLILERPKLGSSSGRNEKTYRGMIQEVKVEEEGPLQAVVRLAGIHKAEDGEEKIPFIIRVSIGLDSPRIGFQHTFLYDGDENRDFLKGVGISFQVPMKGPFYNRHVKFAGDYGVFKESPALLLSWRPRVPEYIYADQISGKKLCPEGADRKIVDKVMENMPFWDQYQLTQDSVNHFCIEKKLKDDNCCYLDCLHGRRSDGGAALGSEAGSVLLSIRDFWETYPSGYTFQGLTEDMAIATAWFWSPRAEAMDFRHYANRGYNQVYYEGYDYKGADPYGIACTSQLTVEMGDELIPSDEKLKEFEENVKYPVQYVADPETYHQLKAFGYWSLPSRNTEMENWLEDQLGKAVDFYRDEVKQRNWYGLFNYGDFMHTYDKERHQWRYDMGGYAWDNTELVPTLWLWYEFLRSGREDAFILAEKLSRHASEVDVYHMGKYKGLGSRHNVRHWGCPCKEARIAMAGHHRVYYYLTGDHRMEDIFEELKDNEQTFYNRDPLGDFYDKKEMICPSHARSGPDWSSLCSNWVTCWERTGDTAYRDKILAGIRDIKSAPLRLISGPDFEFDPADFHLRYIGENASGGTHLQICMGAPQIWMEMAELLEDEEWKDMIGEYGRFYYLPRKEQLEESKGMIGDREFSLPFMAGAMGAYGAARRKDEMLAQRTWKYLIHAMIHGGNHEGFEPITVPLCGNQKELKEIPWITTNFTAQWCLNIIVSLEFIRKTLPKTLTEADKLVASMDVATFRKA